MAYFKKDMLLFWRDRKEILIAIIAPVILIVVLGYALPSWIENPGKSLQMAIALVNEDDERTAMEKLGGMQGGTERVADLEGVKSSEGEPVPDGSGAGLAEHGPVSQLLELLASPDVAEFIEVTELGRAEALAGLEAESIDAVLLIPSGFTAGVLAKLAHGEGDGAALTIYANEASLRLDVLRDVLRMYVDESNFQAAIAYGLEAVAPGTGPGAGVEAGAGVGADADAGAGVGVGTDASVGSDAGVGVETEADLPVVVKPEVQGGYETIGQVRMITSFQYFTFAISIMFALFASLTMATKALVERRERVFERIQLSGSHPFRYLAGKVGSTFIIAWLQLLVVFGMVHVLLGIFAGRSGTFWVGLVLVSGVLAFCIAALSSAVTAMMFRMDGNAALGIFSLVLMLFALVGGNMIPIYVLPDWMRYVGEWTPNGLALAIFIQWVQEELPGRLTVPITQMLGAAVAVLVLATALFPRRRRG